MSKQESGICVWIRKFMPWQVIETSIFALGSGCGLASCDFAAEPFLVSG